MRSLGGIIVISTRSFSTTTRLVSCADNAGATADAAIAHQHASQIRLGIVVIDRDFRARDFHERRRPQCAIIDPL